MRSILTEDFLTCFARLPDEVRAQARRAYRLWRDNPSRRGLRFKPIRGRQGLHSVRVGRDWRPLSDRAGHGHMVLDRVARGLRRVDRLRPDALPDGARRVAKVEGQTLEIALEKAGAAVPSDEHK